MLNITKTVVCKKSWKMSNNTRVVMFISCFSNQCTLAKNRAILSIVVVIFGSKSIDNGCSIGAST